MATFELDFTNWSEEAIPEYINVKLSNGTIHKFKVKIPEPIIISKDMSKVEYKEMLKDK